MTSAFAAFNKRELPVLTPDWNNIDNRRGPAFAPGDMTAYMRDLWDDSPNINMYVEVVHHLDDLGVVITQVARGTSQLGFEAEWRENSIFVLDGDRICRCELFDEADLDAALARFEKLHSRTTPLENAATRVGDRFVKHLKAGDWNAMAAMLADNFSNDDRRRLVGAGVIDGRDAQMLNTRAIADLWSTEVTPTNLATRGRNLALGRLAFSSGDDADGFLTEVNSIIEIDNDQRIVALVVFDLDDFDSAIAELDARYLAGEAAVHARMWSAITSAYAAINRRELPPTTADFEDEDHRRGAAFSPGSMVEYLRAWLATRSRNTFLHRVGKWARR